MNNTNEDITKNSSFFVRQNGVLNKLDWRDIFYVHADGNYCYLHTGSKKFAVKISMRRLFERLEAFGFIRIHKSYVVQAYYIDNINVNNNQVSINGEQLPVGRAFKKALLDKVDVL